MKRRAIKKVIKARGHRYVLEVWRVQAASHGSKKLRRRMKAYNRIFAGARGRIQDQQHAKSILDQLNRMVDAIGAAQSPEDWDEACAKWATALTGESSRA